MSEVSIRRLAVIGVGLIGGSFARALRAAGAVDTVVGCGRDAAHLEQARRLGVIDIAETDPAAAVHGADFVLVAVPVGAMAGVFAAIRDALAPEAVVTDAGSTKLSVIAAAETGFGTLPENFVPGHPIAGTEHSGVDASFAELFRERRVILTPTAATGPAALARVRAAWQATGARVTEMDGAHHDEVLAATSHLPHVLAYALVDTLARMAERTEIFEYAAGGFADFTRIASSSPAMWSDIVTANESALLPVLERYIADLERLRAAIAQDDRETVRACFERAKTARDAFVGDRSDSRNDT
ncbi:Prephenate dehydrogenase [Salinisphaera sp. PC39]|uniref:prephenate dehydrogenase n=1 Tax=Salinisphaera sp. PC39 TaxID=1304156 RepID=UPI003340F0A5